MYLKTRNHTTSEKAMERKKEALQLLKDSTEGLTMNEEEHRYFLHDREMKSVSSIVEHYAPFDNMGVATGCSRNPNHEFYGKDPAEIVEIWKERGRAASKAGTEIHLFGEACFLTVQGLENEIEGSMRERITGNGLVSSSYKEEALVKWWCNLDMDRYTPVAKETRIVNPALEYAGTIDMLLYDNTLDGFVLTDYKSNRNIWREVNEQMLPPFYGVLKTDDIGKYTLQQNLYKMQLENLGIKIISINLIWLKEDGNYENITLPDRTRLVKYALTNN